LALEGTLTASALIFKAWYPKHQMPIAFPLCYGHSEDLYHPPVFRSGVSLQWGYNHWFEDCILIHIWKLRVLGSWGEKLGVFLF